MHWRWLVPFPLAAFLCGEAVQAPRLRPPLPPWGECADYEGARQRYLLAHAYAIESPAFARQLARASLKSLNECPGPAADTLRTRGRELLTKLGESP